MSSTDSQHINYYRILSLTFEASSKTLQSYLRHYYHAKGIQTFAEYLSHSFHVLFFLWSKSQNCACGEARSPNYHKGKPILTEAQWNVLFQEVSEEGSKCRYIPRVDVERESLDVTLSASMLINIYGREFSSDILGAVEILRDNRNMIIHRAAAKMSDAEFNSKWTSTEHAIMTVAKTLPEQEYKDMREMVMAIRCRFIDEMECTRFVTLLQPFVRQEEHDGKIETLLDEVRRIRTDIEGLKLTSYVFMGERMNGNPLTETEKQEIETAFCYSLKKAVTGILQRESHDSQLVNEVLKNSHQLLKQFEDLHARTNDSHLSSVVLDLVFQNCSDLEIFMDKCRHGQIAVVVQNTLVTERILSILHLRSLQLSVNVSDEDFDKYHKRLKIKDSVSQNSADTHELPNAEGKNKKEKALCMYHSGKEYEKICTVCKVPCCVECMATDHGQHPCIDISEIRDEVELSLSSLENITVPEMEQMQEVVLRGIDEYNESMDIAMEKSKQRFQLLRSQLDDAESEWNQQLIERKQRDLAEMEKRLANIDSKLRQVQSIINLCKTSLQEMDASILPSLQSQIAEDKNLGPRKSLLPAIVRFVSSDYQLPAAEKLLGKIHSGVKQNIHIEKQEELHERRREFFTENMLEMSDVAIIEAYADHLSFGEDNEMHAYCENEKTITIYNEDFEIKYAIDLDIKVVDLSYSPSHGIISTDWDSCRIMKISSFGDVESLFETWPLKPGGLCINDKEDIVVGMHDEFETPLNLTIYSGYDYHMVQEIARNTEDKPLFTLAISQLKQNGNGDYIVSDFNRLVSVSRYGQYRWEYCLYHDCVFGIACDKYDNIIITQSNAISLLDSDGFLISSILTTEDGISNPVALAIDSKGRMWIALDDEIKVMKYIKEEV